MVGTAKNPASGKLVPNWEWSYKITAAASIGAYYLEDLDENIIPHPWNVKNLRHYYYYCYELPCYSYLIYWRFIMDAFAEVITIYRKVLSVKQNLGLFRLLESQALGKLTL